jgi:putative PIN family toxin of toxin-antitoxin system
VVFDTNVLLSGLVFGGLCHRIMLAGIENHDVFLSPAILNEVADKLAEKFAHMASTREEAVHALRAGCQWIEPAPLPAPVCRDVDDDLILATAVAARAEYLVTGDKDLLTLGTHGGTAIVTPREFLRVLAEA